jgi:hypothetical protein
MAVVAAITNALALQINRFIVAPFPNFCRSTALFLEPQTAIYLSIVKHKFDDQQ